MYSETRCYHCGMLLTNGRDYVRDWEPLTWMCQCGCGERCFTSVCRACLDSAERRHWSEISIAESWDILILPSEWAAIESSIDLFLAECASEDSIPNASEEYYPSVKTRGVSA